MAWDDSSTVDGVEIDDDGLGLTIETGLDKTHLRLEGQPEVVTGALYRLLSNSVTRSLVAQVQLLDDPPLRHRQALNASFYEAQADCYSAMALVEYLSDDDGRR